MARVRVKGYTYRRRGKLVTVKPHVRVSTGVRRATRATFRSAYKGKRYTTGSLSLRHVSGRNRRGGVPKIGRSYSQTRIEPPNNLPNLKSMQIHEISDVIERDWGRQGRGVNYAARPYLDAMRYLGSVSDNYGMDSGRSVVAYFLSNASSWKGPTAKAVKAELKRRIAR